MKKHILIIVVFIFGCFGIDGTGDAWAEAGIVSEYDESIPNEYYASYYPQPGEPTGHYTVEDLINSSPFLYWDGMLETGAVAEGCCLFDNCYMHVRMFPADIAGQYTAKVKSSIYA